MPTANVVSNTGSTTWRQHKLAWVAVAVLLPVYAGSLALTIKVAKGSAGVPIFCPAIGAAIGIAYLAVRTRFAMWPAVAAAIIIGEVIGWQVDGLPLIQIVAMGFAHAAEVVVSALGARWFRNRFQVIGLQMRAVAVIVVAALLGPTLGALLAGMSARAVGYTESVMDLAVTWWLADVLGVLVVTPFLTTLSPGLRGAWRAADELFPGEALLAGLSLLAATALLWNEEQNAYTFPGVFVSVWIAVRLGVGATSTAVLLFASALSLTTHWKEGPFTGSFADSWARAFIAFYVVTLLVVSLIAAERHRALEEARQMHVQLEMAASVDELTGLSTRQVLEQRAEALLLEISRSQSGESALLLALDLDEFANVNTVHGRACADDALRELARRLSAQVSTAACLARIGGDEFAVLLAGHFTEQAAIDLATQLRYLMGVPILCNSVPVTITASIGVALAQSGSSEQVLRDVEAALHDAKIAGRNRVVLRRAAQRESFVQEQELINRMPHALINREFVCVYQPIAPIPGRTGSAGAEMLTRWQHPDRGQLMPTEFLPPLQRAGLMPRLSDYLLDEALRGAAIWRATKGDAPHWVSVNMSPSELLSVDAARRIESALSAALLPASCLTIEITEEAMVAMSGVVRGVLSDIKALGVSIAVDDFGTGFSGLAYLTQLPIDVVKLDRQFLLSTVEPRANRLLRSVCALAHDLGLRTVVEGVETQEHYDRACDAGADAVQGWFVGRPVSAQDIQIATAASGATYAETTRTPATVRTASGEGGI